MAQYACCRGSVGRPHERLCQNWRAKLRVMVEFVGGPRDGERVLWDFETTESGAAFRTYYLKNALSPVKDAARFVPLMPTEMLTVDTYILDGLMVEQAHAQGFASNVPVLIKATFQ